MILEVAMPKLEQVERKLGTLSNQAPKVMSRAINSTIRRVQSNISKAAQKEYIVKAAGVKKTLTVKKAKVNDLSGEVRSRSSERIKLISFRVNPREPLAETDFYQARVKKKNKLTPMRGSSDRSKAFVAQMKSGHIGVFERMAGVSRGTGSRKDRPWWAKEAKDEKLAEMTGPAVPSMLRDFKVATVILEEANRHLKGQIDKEVQRLLRG